MYVIETVSRLVLLFAKVIAIVTNEAIDILIFQKTIVFAIWVALSLTINVIWIVRVNLKKHLNLPVVYLFRVNLVLIATFIETEWMFIIKILYPGADAVCKLLKCIQVACVMISSGLIIYIIHLFRQPQKLPRTIKKTARRILGISLILTFPQVHLFATHVVASNKELSCTVDTPHEHTNFMLFFLVPFAAILLSHVYLYYIVKGTSAEFFARAEIKWALMQTYCVVHIHFWCVYLVLSAISYVFPTLIHLVECFHVTLIESGRMLVTLSPFIVTRILDKIPSEGIPPNRRFRRILPSSSSSYDIRFF